MFAPSQTSRFSLGSTAEFLAALILLSVGVSDRSAFAQTPSAIQSEVRLRWRVPGDDGWAGNAIGYDLRASIDPLLLTTIEGFRTAAQPLSMPTPRPLGNTYNDSPTDRSLWIYQSVRVRGLPVGRTIYFSIRTIDESGNWSNLPPAPTASIITAGETQPGNAVEGDDIVIFDAATGTIDEGPPRDPPTPTISIDAPKIVVAPNPVDRPRFATMILDIPENDTRLKIYDISGRLKWESSPFLNGHYNLSLTSFTSDWTSGVYLAVLEGPAPKSKRKTVKFEITK